jgi:hypothetical protein
MHNSPVIKDPYLDLVFVWDNWGGVWGVGGAGNLHCNADSSFENWGLILPELFQF